MQDKQKVTLYLASNLHRQLKIKAAVEAESMSAMVEKAIVFYLQYPEVVAELEDIHGKAHRVYSCPECHSSVVQREGELVSLKNPANFLSEEIPEELSVETVRGCQGEEQLVPC